MPSRNPAATVLLAENDERSFDATARLLREAGFAVLHATTIVDALDLLRGARRIDLLVTAARLPGQPSGFVLARMARQRRADIPVLYLGEPRDVPEREAARALGPVLCKPIEPDVLLRAARAAITDPA